MPTVLVIGGTGFLGTALLRALERESDVVAIGRRPPDAGLSRRFVPLDLADDEAIRRAVADIRPDVVYHLAGRTPPADPATLFRQNTKVTIGLVDALRRLDRPVRLVIAGSAAEYGPVPSDRLPAEPATPCRPCDAYGLSKWFATTAVLRAGPPIEAVAARVFNPIGPGGPTRQVFGAVARLLADGARTLRLGDLDTRRDFVDVRDVASGLIALARSGRPGRAYPLGSGRSVPVREGVAHLIRRGGRPVIVEEVEGRGRGPADSFADIGPIASDTGWRPAIAIERSLDDLWDEVRPTAPDLGRTRVPA